MFKLFIVPGEYLCSNSRNSTSNRSNEKLSFIGIGLPVDQRSRIKFLSQQNKERRRPRDELLRDVFCFPKKLFRLEKGLRREKAALCDGGGGGG